MSDKQTAACPKCGFSDAWDGTRCRHCPHCEPQPERTIRVFVVEEAPTQMWRSSLGEFTRDDPKGYEGANYLRCRDACGTFSAQVAEFDVTTTTPVADLILRVAGERPRNCKRLRLPCAPEDAHPGEGKLPSMTAHSLSRSNWRPGRLPWPWSARNRAGDTTT
jgi:hypothetical protein